MKNLIYLCAAFFALPSFGMDTLKISPSISKVTVFFTGAEIHHESTVNLNPGPQVLRMENLPLGIDHQSVQVAGSKDITIRSVRSITQEENLIKGVMEEELEENLLSLDVKIARLSEEHNALSLEEGLLKANQDIAPGADGSVISQLKLASAYYRTRNLEIRNRKISIKLGIRELENQRRKLLQQQKTLNGEGKEKSVIYIELDPGQARNSEIEISYFIGSATWKPEYDFRVNGVDQPLLLDFKAKIAQSTGLDWTDVNLTLSTASPSQSGMIPGLTKWYITRPENRPLPATGKLRPGDHSGHLAGSVYDAETKEPLPFANIVLKKGEEIIAGTASDFDGNYRISPVPVGQYTVEASFIGYSTQTRYGLNIIAGDLSRINFEMGMEANILGEIEVVEYSVPLLDAESGRGKTVTTEEIQAIPQRDVASIAASVAGAVQADDGVSLERIFISNTLKKTVVTNEFEIDEPYTVLSNGQEMALRIKQDSIPVEYTFHLIPRLSKAAYLTARIPDWQYLNLLSAEAGIYYQGTFQGKTYLDADVLTDTLEIGLGKDESIQSERTSDRENLKRFNLGKTMKEEIAWKIQVYNGKGTEIEIIIEDQYPFSNRTDITVEPKIGLDARVDEVNGIIRWRVKMEAKETIEKSYAYEVEYPKAFEYLFR